MPDRDFTDTLVRMAEHLSTGPGDASSDLLARVEFLEACRDPEAAVAYLQPAVRCLAEVAGRLRDRWSQLHQSVEPFQFPEPGRTYAANRREEDLSPWQEDSKLPVSVDIFDTCLVRLLPTPLDVFHLLGDKVEAVTGFSSAEFSRLRESVENGLRLAGLEEGTREDTHIEAIYDKLAAQLEWPDKVRQQILRFEIQLEHFFLRAADPVRQRLLKLRDRGLLLAYTSEMYLPATTLASILEKQGFPVDGIKVYSSGEEGLSKGSGNLYRKVLHDHPGQSLLHVGDNPVSDGTVPNELGISPAIIKTSKETYPDRFSNILRALATSELPGTYGFWEAFGFRVAAPLQIAFASHVYRHARERGHEATFFLSRDGWFPKMVFDRLQHAWGSVTDSHYMYASRELLGLGSMTDINAPEWDFLLKASPLLRVKDVPARLGIAEEDFIPSCARHGLPDPQARVCHHWGYIDSRDRDRLYNVIADNLDQFLAYRARVREGLLGYADSLGIVHQSSLVVDLGWAGSSLACLKALSPAQADNLHGAYFSLLGKAVPDCSDYFTTGNGHNERTRLLKGSIALLEFLFGSPESTVRGMTSREGEWKPVFRAPLPRYDTMAWEGMRTGLLAAVDAFVDICARPPDGDGLPYVEEVLHQLIFHPDAVQLHMLGPLSHAEGWGTDNRLRLLPCMEQLDSDSLQEALCYAPWKPGLLAAVSSGAR